MIDRVLSRVLDWRNLPAYRLESRFDPYVAHFLPEVLAGVVGDKFRSFVLPELPLQRKMLYGAAVASPNKSTKVDFTLFSQTGQRVVLVEVKTDDASRRDEQDDYLVLAKQRGWRQIMEGILAIAAATDDVYVPKYDKLLLVLTKLGYISYTAVGGDTDLAATRAAINSADTQPQCDAVALDVYFVQPSEDGNHTISFEQFASALDKSGDPLAPFVTSALRRLTTPAGRSAEGLLDAL